MVADSTRRQLRQTVLLGYEYQRGGGHYDVHIGDFTQTKIGPERPFMKINWSLISISS